VATLKPVECVRFTHADSPADADPQGYCHLSATVTAGQPRCRTPCVGGGPQRIRRSDL